MLSISSLSKNTANTSISVFRLHIKTLSLQQREKHMKTELSHNKIALYKSEQLLGMFMITLFSVLYFSPYMPSFSLPS